MRAHLGFLLLLAACGGGTGGSGGTPPEGRTLLGAGTAPTPTLEPFFAAEKNARPTGFGWNPSRPEQLWLLNYDDDSALIVTGAGTPDARAERRRDPAADHFMNKPTGIAFSAKGEWATCGENNNEPDPRAPGFTGPSLFPSDLFVFARANPIGLGSHLDMLHDSPFCMGVAHERDNVFWVFDGEHGSLTRYDFATDHGPGMDDHSDGTIRRYVEGKVARSPKVPSHLAFDPESGMLYAADTGHGRVVQLDTRTGTPGATLRSKEPLEDHAAMDGAALTEVVPPGTLEQPSGLALHDGVLYVGDHATGKIHAFDLAGQALAVVDTGLGARALGALGVGPDGALYALDSAGARILKVVPAAAR